MNGASQGQTCSQWARYRNDRAIGARGSYAHALSIILQLVAGRASLLYNRSLYPFPSLQTWSIRDLVSHEYYYHRRLSSSNFASEVLLRILLARLKWLAYKKSDAEWLN